MLWTSYCYGVVVVILLVPCNSRERGILEMDMIILSIRESTHEL